jgi:hypothetical protein
MRDVRLIDKLAVFVMTGWALAGDEGKSSHVHPKWCNLGDRCKPTFSSMERHMPLPFLFLAGAAKAAAHVTTTIATKVVGGAVKGSVAKGSAVKGTAGKGSSGAKLPPGTTTAARKLAERFVDNKRDDDKTRDEKAKD